MADKQMFYSVMPEIGNLLEIRIISGDSISTIYVRAIMRKGSVKKRKITVQARADSQAVPVYLIWKPSTGWICWIAGKKVNVRSIIIHTE